MKFSLYKELLNENDIMSHVFLECVDESVADIAYRNKGKTSEEIEKTEIDISLTIDGEECDPRKFFNLFFEQYNMLLKQEASKMVKKQTSEKLEEVIEKIQGFKEVIDDWANEINWEINNPLTKVQSRGK